MTVTQAVTRLLRHFSDEERSIPSSVTYPGRCEECLDALNDAFTELVEFSPAFLRKDTRGRALAAPASVSLAVTLGSTSATLAGASYATWMPGSTVVIAGSEIDNEILESTAAGADWTLTLRFPFDGATGSKAATIYNDAFTLLASEIEIIEPVEILGVAELGKITGPADLKFPLDTEDYSRRTRRHLTSPSRRSQVTGDPAVYWVEDHVPSSTASEMVRRLRVFPLPSAAGTLSYESRIAQPVYATVDGTVIPLSERHASAVLLPMAVNNLRRSTYFISGSKERQIEADYAKAVAMARNLSPSPRTGPVFRPAL